MNWIYLSLVHSIHCQTAVRGNPRNLGKNRVFFINCMQSKYSNYAFTREIQSICFLTKWIKIKPCFGRFIRLFKIARKANFFSCHLTRPFNTSVQLAIFTHPRCLRRCDWKIFITIVDIRKARERWDQNGRQWNAESQIE